jgi:small nuclear ribonucleoprotein (snRNP)-like protein
MGPSSAIVVAPNSPQPQTNMSAPSADGSTEAPSGGMPPSVRGLVLDRQGDILIPFYIEFQTAKVTPIRIDLGNGQTVTAQFIGGDRATNLTVVRVEQLHLEPCLLAQQAPTEGVMTMVISSIDGAARVGVFPPALSDNGFLFSDKAEVLGLVRYGDYFSASTCRHLADQLIQHGEIRRSSLGVKVTETPLDPALAAASTGRAWAVARGLRVSQSIPGSPAGLAGIGSGDILLSLGQTPLTDIPMLAAELAERLGPTEMKFLRNGVVHSVMVELRSRTAADDAQTLQSPMGSPPSR